MTERGPPSELTDWLINSMAPTEVPGRAGRRPGKAGSREAILAAAAQVFAESGLAGARTGAIAAAARVNKALLYYYFRSKEELYEAVLDRHVGEFNRRAVAVLTAPGPARAILLRYAELHFDFLSRRHRWAPLFNQLRTGGGKPMERLARKYGEARVGALKSLLARGMRDGEFREADRLHTAISIASMIAGYFVAAPMLRLAGRKGNPYSAANLRSRKREVLAFIRHGLFRNPDSPIP